MIGLKNIRKIPKYMLAKIQKLDKQYYIRVGGEYVRCEDIK